MQIQLIWHMIKTCDCKSEVHFPYCSNTSTSFNKEKERLSSTSIQKRKKIEDECLTRLSLIRHYFYHILSATRTIKSVCFLNLKFLFLQHIRSHGVHSNQWNWARSPDFRKAVLLHHARRRAVSFNYSSRSHDHGCTPKARIYSPWETRKGEDWFSLFIFQQRKLWNRCHNAFYRWERSCSH